jgi:hypothetical protein
VLAPTDGSRPALADLVPWWADFVAKAQQPKPDPVLAAQLNHILRDTVDYMRTGFGTGVLT